MVIYKIVTEEQWGDAPEIYSFIYADRQKAIDRAQELSKVCVVVTVYREDLDESEGYFRTKCIEIRFTKK